MPSFAAKTLIANNLTIGLPHTLSRVDQLVGETLMIPFLVVVVDERIGSSSQGALTKENHLVERFGLDRPHEPLQVCVEIR